MAAASSTQSTMTSDNTVTQENLKPKSSRPDAIAVKKTSPPIALDLFECASALNERPLIEIRHHLQASIKASNRTKEIEIRAMSRDSRKEHRYFMFVKSQKEEDTLRTHLYNWLHRSFPKALVQSTTFYPTRVDSVKAEAVLDPVY